MIITNSNNVIAMTILRPSRDASLGRIREGVPSRSWCLRRGGVPDLTWIQNKISSFSAKQESHVS